MTCSLCARPDVAGGTSPGVRQLSFGESRVSADGSTTTPPPASATAVAETSRRGTFRATSATALELSVGSGPGQVRCRELRVPRIGRRPGPSDPGRGNGPDPERRPLGPVVRRHVGPSRASHASRVRAAREMMPWQRRPETANDRHACIALARDRQAPGAFPRSAASERSAHTYQYTRSGVSYAVMRLHGTIHCDKDAAGRGG